MHISVTKMGGKCIWGTKEKLLFCIIITLLPFFERSQNRSCFVVNFSTNTKNGREITTKSCVLITLFGDPGSTTYYEVRPFPFTNDPEPS